MLFCVRGGKKEKEGEAEEDILLSYIAGERKCGGEGFLVFVLPDID